MPYLLDRNEKSYKQSVLTGVTGESIKIAPKISKVTVSLLPSGGASGKVQFTTSTYKEIDEGTATWFDWPKGVISVNTYDGINFPITGLRPVSSSGTLVMEVVL